MTFEQQFATWVIAIILIGALVLYGVHRATRQKTFKAVRADLVLHQAAPTGLPKHRRDAHPLDRAAVALTGGADFPDVGRHHRSSYQHAHAA